jgi:hypothetical protein
VETALGALTWLLLAGVMHIQSAHADLHRQPTLGFFVALGGPGAPLPVGSPAQERLEEKLRERLYSSGSGSGVKKECARSADSSGTAIG